MAQRRQLAQDIDPGGKAQNRLVVRFTQMNVKIDLHAAADLVIRARGLRLDARQFFPFKNLDGRRKFDFEGPNLFSHRRRITFANLNRFRRPYTPAHRR
jgi:hypothetical protein